MRHAPQVRANLIFTAGEFSPTDAPVLRLDATKPKEGGGFWGFVSSLTWDSEEAVVNWLNRVTRAKWDNVEGSPVFDKGRFRWVCMTKGKKA